MQFSRRGDVAPFLAMDIMEAARAAEAEGRDIIHMEVGQPSIGAPDAARAALARDIEAGPLGYTVALGLPELRARIARHYGEWYDVDLDPSRVVVTAGASGAFLLAFSALFDNGDRVGLGVPCYPSYRQILGAMGLDPVGIRTTLESNMQPTPDQVRDADIKGLILASPGNPTGTILDRDGVGAIAQTCDAAGISLISDEIYHGLDYGQSPASALQVTDNAYVVNSFSKYFTLTGWRVGWMVVPPDHVRTVERLAQNMFICAPHASQRLALHCLNNQDVLRETCDVYAANRQEMLDRFPKMGLTRFAPPDGAFYVYVDVSAYTDDSLALSQEILKEVGVAVTPGLDFDPEEGHHWMRFSYARDTDHIREGLDRLERFFAGRG